LIDGQGTSNDGVDAENEVVELNWIDSIGMFGKVNGLKFEINFFTLFIKSNIL